MRLTATLAAAVVAVAFVSGCSSPSGSPGSPESGGSGGNSPSGSTLPPLAENNPVGDIPDNTAYVAYRPSAGQFEVKVPEGWARTTSGAAVVFGDKLNAIRMETLSVSAAPTVASAQANEVPAIQAASTRFALKSVKAEHRNGGDVVLVTYEADSPPDPVTGKVIHDDVERYEFFRAGTEAILTLSGPVGADNVDPWRTVSDSLRWL
ncbi:MAG: hypothetical protein QOE61_2707 [Micromonosporaceae bacterium]|jgi:hypothetical protein|nr:hypothetical protein [Micromonosporaceae bacterium]